MPLGRRNQCTSLNTLGKQCKWMAERGSTLCRLHNPTSRRRCLAITADGEPCTGYPLKKENVCAAHLSEAKKFRNEQQVIEPVTPPEDPVDDLVEITDCKEFAKAILDSREFREYIVDGLRGRDLPSSVVLRLMDYAEGWGKPVEQVEVKNTTPVEEMTAAQIKERAAFLMKVIDALEDEDDTSSSNSVH